MKISNSLPLWQKILLWGTGSVSLMMMLLFWGIWRTSGRALTLVENLFQPEPEIAIPTLIVEQIKEMEELTTTVYTIETIVPTSAERKLGEWSLGTTKLLYIAQGEVRAGIDLSQLTAENIKLVNNRIQIQLPPAQILDSKIDITRSRVYDYDRGFLNLGPDVAPQLQTLAQRKTLTEIVNTACQEGILTTANQKAETIILKMLTLSNDKQITIKSAPELLSSCHT